LQRPQIAINEHNIGSGGTVGYANSQTAANTFFPNWEHAHHVHDRLIKKTEVGNSCRIFYSSQFDLFSI